MENQSVQQKAIRVLLADSHQNMLEGIRSLLETVFEVVVMVARERKEVKGVSWESWLRDVRYGGPLLKEAGINYLARREAGDLA